MSFLVTETPEGLSLRSEIAGAGSRSLASLMDMLLLVGALYVGLILSLVVPGIGSLLGNWLAMAFGLLLMFYQVTCAVFLKGATPGKLLNRLVVVDQEGFPASLSQHLLRGIFWPLEMIPFPLPIGMLCMLGNAQHRRLGDFVAGTLVLRLPSSQLPQDPYLSVDWTKLSMRRLNLVPAHSTRFDDRDLDFLRKLIGRQEVDRASYEGLVQRALEHYLNTLELKLPERPSAKEARAILSELYVFLRHMRSRTPS